MSTASNRVRARLFKVPAVGVFGAALLAASPALAGTWGSFNYGGGTVDMYTPNSHGASPGLVVLLHFCGGTAADMHGQLDSQADQFGFYLIAPQAPNAGANICFDASLGRSGERATIVSMVTAMIQQNNVDKTRVFAAGASSGGCMSEALLASYPDVFAAGSALAGVPAGAWTGGDMCSICGQNAPSMTGAQWANLVTMADPGFTGTRPRVQIWSGKQDTTLNYPSEFDAEELQWATVFGFTVSNTSVPFTAGTVTGDRFDYKDSAGTVEVEATALNNEPHNLLGLPIWPDVVHFFGLDKTGAAGDGGAGGTDSGMAASSSGGPASGGADAGKSSSGGVSSSSSSGAGSSGGAMSGSTSGSSGGAVSSSSSGSHSASSSGSGATGGGSNGGVTGQTSSSGSSSGSSGAVNGSTGGSTGNATTGGGGNGNTGSSTTGTSSSSGASGNASASGSNGSGSGGGSQMGGGCGVAPGNTSPSEGLLAAAGLLGLAFVGRRRRRG